MLRSHCHLLVSATVDLDRAPSTALPLPDSGEACCSSIPLKLALLNPNITCDYRLFACSVEIAGLLQR